jgi:hypothetical protein
MRDEGRAAHELTLVLLPVEADESEALCSLYADPVVRAMP